MTDSAPSATPLARPEVVFFDLGDTLVRPEPSWADVYLGACASYGLEIERSDLKSALRDAVASDAFIREGPFEASAEASYAQIKAFDAVVMAELGYPDLPDEFYRGVEAAFESRAAWHIFPDVVRALDALATAGIRMGIISNWVWGAPELLHDLELTAHFDALVISARIGYQKPNRAIFDHALDALGATPEAAIHVGDSFRADVAGARSVGIQPVLIDRFGGERGDDAVRATSAGVPVVTDLLELCGLISVEAGAAPAAPTPARGAAMST